MLVAHIKASVPPNRHTDIVTDRSGSDEQRATPPPDDDAEPVLPDTTSDERDVGWGDDGRDAHGKRDEEWYRNERPPHHE